jgi:hypothetical protein
MPAPRCTTCGDRIGFNPRAQPYWTKSGREGTVPGAGWYHAEAEYGGYSRMKTDPDFHYVAVPSGITPESEMTRKQAESDQMRSHVEQHLSRQFDFLAAEKRGGTHIDLSEG